MENEKNHAIPGAIVIAGLIIAGAIYFKTPNPAAAPGAVSEKRFDQTALLALAEATRVDQTAFTQCLSEGRFKAKITAQSDEAVALGAQGTPFPIITTASGEMIVLPGAVPADFLKPLLNDLVAGKSASTTIANIPDANLRAALATTLAAPLPPITAADHLTGNPDAPIKILEYSDLECPFCKQFHETMIEIMTEYGPTGKVAWAYRHFPLSIHPQAIPDAEAAECIGALNGEAAFWDFITQVFAAH